MADLQYNSFKISLLDSLRVHIFFFSFVYLFVFIIVVIFNLPSSRRMLLQGKVFAVAVSAGGGHAAAARPAAVTPWGPRAPGAVHALRPRPEGDADPLVAPLRVG